MSLITDADYLIYQMRLAMLRMDDNLFERVISVPTIDDNEYINASTEHVGLNRGTTSQNRECLLRSPLRSQMSFSRASGRPHAAEEQPTRVIRAIPQTEITQKDAPQSSSVASRNSSGKPSLASNANAQITAAALAPPVPEKREMSESRSNDENHERRMATIEMLKLRLQHAQQTLQKDQQSSGSGDSRPDHAGVSVGDVKQLDEGLPMLPDADDESVVETKSTQSERNSLKSSMRDAIRHTNVVAYSSQDSPQDSIQINEELTSDDDRSDMPSAQSPSEDRDELSPIEFVKEAAEVERDRLIHEIIDDAADTDARRSSEDGAPSRATSQKDTGEPNQSLPQSFNGVQLPQEDLFVKRELPLSKPPDPFTHRNASSLYAAKPRSALTSLLNEQSRSDNPFGKDYSYFSGKGDPNPIRLKIYMPISEEPEIPLDITVLRDATVEDVMGYALYEYWTEGRKPAIPEHLRNVVMWNMRIVEDDGTIDDDFPALERTRKISKFAFDQFALCEASPDQIKLNENNARKPPTSESGSVGNGGAQSPAATTVFLKVHLYSTIEVKQTTTMPVPSNIPLAEVFEQICRKRKYDPSKYVFKMADTKTDVPLDKTLDQLRVSELCILKRAGGGAGDVFLRPPDEKHEAVDQPRFVEPDEYSSMYKQYTVSYKAFMGRAHERLLTIDGDYIHIMAGEHKNIFDTMKTSSHHISSVVSCKAMKGTSFRLLVHGSKGSDARAYDFDAASPNEAAEISTKISFLIQMNKRESGLRLR